MYLHRRDEVYYAPWSFMGLWLVVGGWPTAESEGEKIRGECDRQLRRAQELIKEFTRWVFEGGRWREKLEPPMEEFSKFWMSIVQVGYLKKMYLSKFWLDRSAFCLWQFVMNRQPKMKTDSCKIWYARSWWIKMLTDSYNSRWWLLRWLGRAHVQ